MRGTNCEEMIVEYSLPREIGSDATLEATASPGLSNEQRTVSFAFGAS